MFRKTLLALTALAAIGTAVFAVSIPVASANGYNQHRHHHWRPAVRFSTPSLSYYGSCYVRRVTHTPFGLRVNYVNICY